MESLKSEYKNLRPLEKSEMDAVQGGGLPSLVWTVLSSLVSHFGDLREGLSDGYKNVPPRY